MDKQEIKIDIGNTSKSLKVCGHEYFVPFEDNVDILLSKIKEWRDDLALEPLDRSLTNQDVRDTLSTIDDFVCSAM